MSMTVRNRMSRPADPEHARHLIASEMGAEEQDAPPEREQPLHLLEAGALDLEASRAFAQQEQPIESHLREAEDVADRHPRADARRPRTRERNSRDARRSGPRRSMK